ncbi:MAG TPA: ParA family protein [candidate division Zixibacteria bacterium]|nr:ParA family protein [candidate division Zixibacteria bacterium]
MDNINTNTSVPEILSFLSGKGGSGKTTSSLAIAKILSDIGLRVLLIDFDLSTSGASYFFMPKINEARKKGLSSYLENIDLEITNLLYEKQKLNKEEKIDLSWLLENSILEIENLTIDKQKIETESIINIEKNFDFISSRTNLSKPFHGGPNTTNKKVLIVFLQNVFKSLTGSYDYIILDNQAGYNNTSAAGAALSNKAIIVSESDQISSDAVDNLISLVGSDMPQFRRYLINKIEIREQGDYRNKLEAFKSINRLPPLPFDFSVRNAFGQRKIPIDLEKPTSFLMALFTTIKEILPEKHDLFEKYESERVIKIFDKYQKELDELILERDETRNKIAEIESLANRMESDKKIFSSKIQTMVSMVVAMIAITFSMSYMFEFNNKLIISFSTALLAGLSIAITFFIKKRSDQIRKDAELDKAQTKEKLILQRKMQEIETEVNRYNNLVATKSRELLVDFNASSRQ